jgi:mono/diheme cytochrome c family protein
MKKSALLKLLVLSLSILVLAALAGTAAGESKGNAQAGASLHKQQCLRCHGEQGKGDGPASKLLNPKPHDWADKQYMSKLSDDDLYKIIAKGGPAVGKSKLMTAFDGKLKENEIHNLIAFIRSLGGK